MSAVRDLILRTLQTAPRTMPLDDLATALESVLIIEGFVAHEPNPD